MLIVGFDDEYMLALSSDGCYVCCLGSLYFMNYPF